LRESDFGGCRCQALALTGDAGATDPACHLSPHHSLMSDIARREGGADSNAPFEYRRPAISGRGRRLSGKEKGRL
jgi:PqqA peptide cyclase